MKERKERKGAEIDRGREREREEREKKETEGGRAM
jgi:hypothetical protein